MLTKKELLSRLVFIIPLIVCPIVAGAQESPQSEEMSSAENLNLEIAKARLMVEEGKSDEGLALFNDLQLQYPSNHDLLLSIASAEASLGRRRQAVRYLDEANAGSPLDEGLRNFREELFQEQRSFGRVEFDIRDSSSSATQYIERIAAEAPVSGCVPSPWHLGVLSEANQAEFKDIQRSDGSLSDFEGERNRNQLYLRYMFEEQHDFFASLYEEEYLFGAGVAYKHHWNQGVSNVSLDFSQPNWDYVGLIADYGTRDRVRIAQEYQPSSKWLLSLSTATQRYNIKGIAAAETTQSLGTLIKYQALSEKIKLDFKYLIHAEYGITHRDKNTGAGDDYNPLPFEGFEYHIFDVSSSYQIIPDLNAGAFGGYAFNRLGESAPHVGAWVEYHLGRDISANAQIERTFSTAGAGATEDRLFCYLTWWM